MDTKYKITVNSIPFELTFDGGLIIDDNYKRLEYFLLNVGYYDNINIDDIITDTSKYKEFEYHIKNNDIDVRIMRCN